MNVTCAACKTQYKIDAAKVPPTGGFIKCKTCGERIKIPAPATDAAAPGLAGAATATGVDAAVTAPGFAGAATAPLDSPTLPDFPVTSRRSAPPAGAIPLAGNVPAPAEVKAPAAGPRSSTAAPTSRHGAIPLDGTSMPVVKGTAARPAAGSTPAADDAPTQIMERPAPRPAGRAIPLAGADPHEAETLVATVPVPEAALAAARAAAADADDAPTRISEPPAFAATPNTFAELPAASREPTDLPAVSRMPADMPTASRELADLPAAVSALADEETQPVSDGQELLGDLPTPLAVAPGDRTVVDGTAIELDDLPARAPQGAAAATTLDLPVPDHFSSTAVTDVESRPPSFENLPVPDEPAPALMDDLPIASTSAGETAVLEIDAKAMTLAAESQVKPRAELDIPQIDAPGEKPMPRPVSTAPAEAATSAPKTGPKRGRVLALAGVGVAVLLLAVVAVATPYLGLQLFDPLGLSSVEGGETTARPTPPPAKQKADSPAKDKAPPPAKTGPTPPAEPAKVEVVLSPANVDQLGSVELRTATAALAAKASGDGEAAGLLGWARFRLAYFFGDTAARQSLTAALPEPSEVAKLDGLPAATAIGSLSLAGKIPAARKVGEKLARGRLKDSPQLALALATTYAKRPELAKANKELDRLEAMGVQLPDAQLLRGLVLLQGREPEAGAKGLLALGEKSNDLAVRLRVAQALLEAQRVAGMEKVWRPPTPAALEALPAEQRQSALRLETNRTVRDGRLPEALALAQQRAALPGAPLEASLITARLLAATGGDYAGLLGAAAAKLANDEDKARLAAEQVRLSLGARNLDAARAALAGAKALDAKTAGGWLGLAEGWIAAAAGDAKAARAAFTAATKGRPKLAEARLELVLADGKPNTLLKKLSDLDEELRSVPAAYHLARAMRDHGNAAGAVALFERVLWSDPTVVDPIDLVLEWADALDKSGQIVEGEKVARGLHEIRPDDPRPVEQLILAARRGKRYDAAIEWHRLLVTATPNDPQRIIALATTLNDAGKFPEAQKALDDLLKASPAARSVDALVQLARAWAEREPFRAKDLLREANTKEERATTHLTLGRIELDRDNKDDGKKALRRALTLDPTLIEPQLLLAKLALEEGSTAEVIDGLERILARDPAHVEAARLLGDVYAEQGKPREAIKRYEMVLATEGEEAAVLMKVARIQLQTLSQLEPAVKTLRRVIAADPKLAEAHYYLGLAHKDQGHAPAAKQELSTYLRLAPEGELAAEAKTVLQDLESP